MVSGERPIPPHSIEYPSTHKLLPYVWGAGSEKTDIADTHQCGKRVRERDCLIPEYSHANIITLYTHTQQSETVLPHLSPLLAELHRPLRDKKGLANKFLTHLIAPDLFFPPTIRRSRG